MNVEKLLELAGQHVEEITTNKADTPACLSDDDILLSQFDPSDDITSLESILDRFFKPTEDKLGIQVSSASFSLSPFILAADTRLAERSLIRWVHTIVFL